MGYYSRQTCGNMIRTVFKNVAAQLMAEHGSSAAAVGEGCNRILRLEDMVHAASHTMQDNVSCSRPPPVACTNKTMHVI